MKINKSEFYTIFDSANGSIYLTKEEAKKLYEELYMEFGSKKPDPDFSYPIRVRDFYPPYTGDPPIESYRVTSYNNSDYPESGDKL